MPRARATARRGPATTRDRTTRLRTCVGCGRRAAKRELVRFTAVGGMLRSAPAAAGRGAYTCRDVGCFEQAIAHDAFARSLRRAVVVEPDLARLYTEVSHG
jgi:predicted RNA-binding protein YlxR (DUF448 family)